jgi:hydrogenase expression/formation protein HypC
MCIGLPMTIMSSDGATALAERRGEQRRISLLLVGELPVGSQVLVFIDSAVRLLDAEEARQIDDALDGLAAAIEGRDFEHLFADLIDREPQLPEFLRQPAAEPPRETH